MPYIEDAVTVLDTGKRNLVRCEQAAPAAHETLVTGAHSEHLCFGFCRFGCLSQGLLTKECSLDCSSAEVHGLNLS
jgi:hypothetical protein